MARNFPVMQIVACSDLDMSKAQAAAQKHQIPRACTVDELLADQSIQIVLNLTVPKAHVPVSLQALEAGKHVYVEKPLGVNREQAQQLMRAADARKLRVGCAPDTFMGSGLQTARKVIDEGRIGRPVGFTAFFMCPGHESWHPNPEFYYEVGGGPMLDMGPYYVTALLNLLGPVKRVCGMATIAIPQRTITHRDRLTGGPGPKFGKQIVVQTPDHICGLMEFENGCLGTIITSFASHFPTCDGKQPIAIYGTEGTVRVPNPNNFDGPVHLRRIDDADWIEVPPAFVSGYGRAVGLADMAYAIRSGRDHRASGQRALAALDVMLGFLDSSANGRAYEPEIRFTRPAPMRSDLPFGVLDE